MTFSMRVAAVLLATASAFAQDTFTNPIAHGPDPWMVYDNGTYYLMTTPGNHLVIRASKTLAGFAAAQPIEVWAPPANTTYSKQIWAPELHKISGKWYIYFAADAGENRDHRIYVVENPDANPTTRNWNFKGELHTKDNRWAIDLTTFAWKGAWYSVWAGWEKEANGQQNLYIARMKNPWKFATDRVRISQPELPWETFGDLGKEQDVHHVNVNEGPEALIHDGRLFLVYSASGCWTDHYALGMLELKPDGDPMNAGDWTKHPKPVFESDPEAHAYGTGHNGFFTSPDGKENWMVYHANPGPHQGCGNKRTTRAQPFTWNADGTPNFGKPVPLGTELPEPSGTK